MALADTARLIASLELQDKFSGPARKAEGSISGLDRKMSTLGTAGKKLGTGLGNVFSAVAKIGVGAAVAGVGLLTVNIKAGIDSLNELESVVTQTETVIKSTGGIAGQTAEDVRALSEEFESLNATMDDKVIQSGANMLLTFTNIRTEAFEPALEAALDMNQAMGGGPEGLQSTAIRLGKALNDPIKGVGALSRVGVTFTQKQKDLIKTLVDSNDTLGAQQVILDEVSKEFGGQFAAAGGTAEGQMAKLSDTIEDLQQKLAGPLLPAIDRIRDKLTDFLGGKRMQHAAEDLGEAIAGIFTNKNIDRGIGFLEEAIDKVTELAEGGGKGDGLGKVTASIGTIAESVKGLPWESIANAARLLGTGSKALLDAFLGLPPWVQTAVLTGWGLNKLTGGALGGIAGSLGGALIQALSRKFGLIPIQAGVVNVTGPVAGGGAAAGGGFGGILAGILGTAGVAATIGGGVSALPAVTSDDAAEQNRAILDLMGGFPSLIGRAVSEALGITPGKPQPVTDKPVTESIEDLDESIADVDRRLAEAETANVTNRAAVLAALRTERNELVAQRNELRNNRNSVIATGRETAARLRAGFTDNGAKIARVGGSVDSARATAERGNTTLAQIRDNPPRVSVTVDNEVNVSLSATAVALQLQRVTQTTNMRSDINNVVN